MRNLSAGSTLRTRNSTHIPRTNFKADFLDLTMYFKLVWGRYSTNYRYCIGRAPGCLFGRLFLQFRFRSGMPAVFIFGTEGVPTPKKERLPKHLKPKKSQIDLVCMICVKITQQHPLNAERRVYGKFYVQEIFRKPPFSLCLSACPPNFLWRKSALKFFRGVGLSYHTCGINQPFLLYIPEVCVSVVM